MPAKGDVDYATAEPVAQADRDKCRLVVFSEEAIASVPRKYRAEVLKFEQQLTTSGAYFNQTVYGKSAVCRARCAFSKLQKCPAYLRFEVQKIEGSYISHCTQEHDHVCNALLPPHLLETALQMREDGEVHGPDSEVFQYVKAQVMERKGNAVGKRKQGLDDFHADPEKHDEWNANRQAGVLRVHAEQQEWYLQRQQEGFAARDADPERLAEYQAMLSTRQGGWRTAVKVPLRNGSALRADSYPEGHAARNVMENRMTTEIWSEDAIAQLGHPILVLQTVKKEDGNGYDVGLGRRTTLTDLAQLTKRVSAYPHTLEPAVEFGESYERCIIHFPRGQVAVKMEIKEKRGKYAVRKGKGFTGQPPMGEKLALAEVTGEPLELVVYDENGQKVFNNLNYMPHVFRSLKDLRDDIDAGGAVEALWIHKKDIAKLVEAKSIENMDGYEHMFAPHVLPSTILAIKAALGLDIDYPDTFKSWIAVFLTVKAPPLLNYMEEFKKQPPLDHPMVKAFNDHILPPEFTVQNYRTALELGANNSFKMSLEDVVAKMKRETLTAATSMRPVGNKVPRTEGVLDVKQQPFAAAPAAATVGLAASFDASSAFEMPQMPTTGGPMDFFLSAGASGSGGGAGPAAFSLGAVAPTNGAPAALGDGANDNGSAGLAVLSLAAFNRGAPALGGGSGSGGGAGPAAFSLGAVAPTNGAPAALGDGANDNGSAGLAVLSLAAFNRGAPALGGGSGSGGGAGPAAFSLGAVAPTNGAPAALGDGANDNGSAGLAVLGVLAPNGSAAAFGGAGPAALSLGAVAPTNGAPAALGDGANDNGSAGLAALGVLAPNGSAAAFGGAGPAALSLGAVAPTNGAPAALGDGANDNGSAGLAVVDLAAPNRGNAPQKKRSAFDKLRDGAAKSNWKLTKPKDTGAGSNNAANASIKSFFKKKDEVMQENA